MEGLPDKISRQIHVSRQEIRFGPISAPDPDGRLPARCLAINGCDQEIVFSLVISSRGSRRFVPRLSEMAPRKEKPHLSRLHPSVPISLRPRARGSRGVYRRCAKEKSCRSGVWGYGYDEALRLRFGGPSVLRERLPAIRSRLRGRKRSHSISTATSPRSSRLLLQTQGSSSPAAMERSGIALRCSAFLAGCDTYELG
jgi:hypothetical protein